MKKKKSFRKNIQTNKRVVEETKKKKQQREKEKKRERETVSGRKKFLAQICKMSAYTSISTKVNRMYSDKNRCLLAILVNTDIRICVKIKYL